MTTPAQIEQQAPKVWTEERVETLKRLWIEGLSCSQIADLLGNGITRNAIIGKVHRLKLAGWRQALDGSNLKLSRKPQAVRPRSRVSIGRSKSGAANAAGASIVRRTLKALADGPTLPVTPLRETVEAVTGPLLSLIELTEHTCKWATGDPLVAGFGFCGAEPQPGKPYCQAHALRAYTAAAPIAKARQKSIYPAMRSQHA